MNEKIEQMKAQTITFWTSKTKKQKGFFIGSVIVVLLLIVMLLFFTLRTNYAPLYSNLSVEETGQIKETLDSRGIANTINENGTAIYVPRDVVDDVKVELAAEGIPSTGAINYEDFRDSLGFGMTDNEFSVMEKAAMQTELEGLIQTIDGVQSATVMIQLPEETIWLSDDPGEAQASIVLTLAGGYSLDPHNVSALFNLVAKSIPNLPTDNIVITDQLFNNYTYDQSEMSDSTLHVYDQQREIRRNIEQDIQQRLQQMLGMMMGQDKVVVSVTADVDFTQEYREEELVEPVDEDTTEGIAISVERVSEYYEGGGVPEEGVVGTGDDDIANYPAVGATGDGDYERIEERINNDVNRIHRQIQESPYTVRDLGVQVVVEPPDPTDLTSLPPTVIGEIEDMLETVVSTSIASPSLEDMEGDVGDRIVVTAQPLFGKADVEETAQFAIPAWVYVAGGLGLLVLIVAGWLLLRRNNDEFEEFEEEAFTETVEEIPTEDITPGAERRRRLEQLARERPEEFSKLLRTWLSDD
ncbi:flagellar basal-body MS-ring/collar protein FliF [Geomicrobium sp. JCM 19039]|uniref:flagellar basal-body MS-ring/collar protein FliF n=1 Tax=Geomicrobium sp. JCM 19039 TaxID=1460636 RepID=UPI00045F2334|nr:flagellar basal-body MS-ring/collar protein FliF [Geomicrobium sp. JCM 19039]GAK10919.1 flagellar M-ring protein FliF [Geomicrobium sp. JCM 19039]